MTVLDQNKQRLLAKLLREQSAAPQGPQVPVIPPGSEVPLNSAQARIWFFCRAYPASAEYNLPEMRLMPLPLDPAALRAATAALIARHDALRLRVFERDGVPLQRDDGVFDPPVTWYDLRDRPAVEAARAAAETGHRLAQRPIPLAGPLFEVAGFALPGDQTMLALNFHHVVIDGWSRLQIVAELDALLVGRPLDPPSPVGFLDYVAWERQNVDEELCQRELDYWLDKLGGELPVLDLPKDRPRPATSSREGHTVPLAVSAGALTRIRRIAADEGTTPFVVAISAYKVFLARVSRQRDVLVGTSLAGRDHEIAEAIAGCFVKSVALRTSLDGDPTFRDVVRRVHETLLEAHDHQAVPYDRVVAELRQARMPGVHPVFQTFFNLQPPGEGAGGVTDPVVELETNAAKWDLTVTFTEGDDGLEGLMEYAADLFDEPTVARFAASFQRLLTAAATAPDTPAFELPVLDDEERQRILYRLNPHQRPQIPYATMAQPFEEQVRRTPDAVALVDRAQTVSYADLNRRANRLARHLRGRGVRAGTYVAVCLDRGVDVIVALYAAAKLGAPYVPLDPELPDDRIAFMVEDAAPAVVLVDPAARSRMPAGAWSVIDVTDTGAWADESAADLPVGGPGYDLVHLLYTSGTTGRPKAVAYPAAGALADIRWLQRTYPFQPGDTAIFKTSYGFDVSIWEIFWPLYVGASLAICPPGEHKDPQRLLELVERHQVSMMFLVPSMTEPFLDIAPPGSCPSLRWLFCGGEPVTARIRDGFHARFGGQIVNCYGPTEAGCVTDMALPAAPGAPVPLGRPAANFALYVLDEQLEPTPIGVPGEVYIGGEVGLARGYHRRPELTAERFLPDPFGPPGSRMYRTGDLCRYRDDGVLEHLGRIGRQVKVRGMRVELAEIEAVLTEQDGVARCVATVLADRPGDIAAFIVAAEGGEVSVPAVTAAAARLLPAYMMPATVLVVPDIPRFVSGKVDFAALTERGADDPADVGPVTAPEGELETILAGIFGQILGLPTLSVTDSFFELGGHSLLVFRLIQQCSAKLGIRPAVQDVFAAPSVRELAALISAATTPGDANLTVIAENPGRPMIVFVHAASGSTLPFFEVGRRLAGDFAVYGLQALADDPAGGIEDIGRRYREAVDAVRGTVPVILAGWSMGGCVALEMAREWRRQGVPSAAVLMLDTWAPPSFMATDEDARWVRDSILALDVLQLEGAQDAADAVAELDRLVDRNRGAFLDYRPDFYPGEIDLLRASDPLPDARIGFPAGYMDGDRGWAAHCAQVTTAQVHGSHLSLFDAVHAAELAEAIRSVIADRMASEVI